MLATVVGHEQAAEATLTDQLERRLPQHPASIALKRRLAAEYAAVPTRQTTPRRWHRALVPTLAAALLVGALIPQYRQWASAPAGGAAR